jgi:hypothetical protein
LGAFKGISIVQPIQQCYIATSGEPVSYFCFLVCDWAQNKGGETMSEESEKWM